MFISVQDVGDQFTQDWFDVPNFISPFDATKYLKQMFNHMRNKHETLFKQSNWLAWSIYMEEFIIDVIDTYRIKYVWYIDPYGVNQWESNKIFIWLPIKLNWSFVWITRTIVSQWWHSLEWFNTSELRNKHWYCSKLNKDIKKSLAI